MTGAVIFADEASKRKWAHQDSNLERAGYEPAALTIELWAQLMVPQKKQEGTKQAPKHLLVFRVPSTVFR
jgi:hypothetical protein